MKLALSAATRSVVLVVGLLCAAIALWIALGFQAWTPALQFGGLALLCLTLGYIGVDPANPGAVHRSFQRTARRGTPGDESDRRA